MVRNVLFLLLIGVILLSGLAFAEKLQNNGVTTTSQDSESKLGKTFQQPQGWAVGSGQLRKLDTGDGGYWLSSKAIKQFQYDTLLHFTAEGPSWNDQVQTGSWNTVDVTLEALQDTLWHRDTFNAISGSYSMWWGDTTSQGIPGYPSERYERLTAPKLFIDPEDDWSQLAPDSIPSAREEHDMAYLGDGKVLLFGGNDGTKALNGETWMYDRSEANWIQISPTFHADSTDSIPSVREAHAMASLGAGQVLLFGGDDGAKAANGETWFFDLSDTTWYQVVPDSGDTTPSARYEHAMASLGDGQVLLFGGNDGAKALNGETWLFDISDSSWTPVDPDTTPIARSGHAMAYLDDGKVLLFGGADDTKALNGETWLFDISDSSWTPVDPAGDAPTARYEHAMAYFGRQQVLLFGGNDGSIVDSTYVFDLDKLSWEQRSPTTHPSARQSHAMAWLGDSRVLLFGGDDGTKALKNDTWMYKIGTRTFLVYKHHIRCEEAHGFGIFEGWDGYNIRVDEADDDQGFDEIAPYKVEADSSYYKHPPDPSNEWNILRCWERHGQQIGPYVAPYDQWIGGYACDGTGQGGTETVVTKVYDLRPFAGDTIQIAFDAASDWGYDTSDDSTLFGYLIDDVLIADDLDSTMIADESYSGSDTLYFEDFEDALVGWGISIPNVPTGNWWDFYSVGHTGIYSVACRDIFSLEYPENCDNVIVSPTIFKADLDSNMADMRLRWYLQCDVTGHDEDCGARNEFQLDDGDWTYISTLTHPGGTSYYFGLEGVTTSDWWNTDSWSGFMTDMSPLVLDTSIVWDSLKVRIGFFSNAGTDTSGTKGLAVDDVTLSGRVAAEYDMGVYSLKIPGPDANDKAVIFDSVAVYNYGWHDVASGNYMVYMTVQDTDNVIVWGPQQVLDFNESPNCTILTAIMAPLDTSLAKVTLDEEGLYHIKMWTDTEWLDSTGAVIATDNENWNDTLVVFEHSSGKQYVYPDFYNYPAGQGQLRYHDQGLYYYPYINIASMEAGEIAAVHFTPDESLYPFDLRLALPQCADSNKALNVKVWGSGSSPDAAPLLATIAFNPHTDSNRVELDDYADLQHLSSDFWMGVEFPTATGAIMGVESAENAADQTLLRAGEGRSWDHSWLYTEDEWGQYDDDWLITAVISWRTIDPEVMPSLSGPLKNSSGNLYFDWADVSQAMDYLIYRSTDIQSTFPLLDSTAAGTSNYTDLGVVGDTGTHYYYLFHTRHQDGGVYDKTSKAVGEFDASISNVK
jgi:hypothetical protein